MLGGFCRTVRSAHSLRSKKNDERGSNIPRRLSAVRIDQPPSCVFNISIRSSDGNVEVCRLSSLYNSFTIYTL